MIWILEKKLGKVKWKHKSWQWYTILSVILLNENFDAENREYKKRWMEIAIFHIYLN